MRFLRSLSLTAAVLVGVNLTPVNAAQVRPTVRARLSTEHVTRGNVAAARGGAFARRYSIPDKRGTGDVYISDYGNNVLYGFPAAGGSPNYVVSSGINGPQGLAKTAKNIYLANTNLSQILVFTPPSTTPTVTINESNEYPSGVAVNARGTSIWVSNICSAPSCGMGNLQEYSATGTLEQTITCANMYRYYFVGVDKKGNVAVDGEDSSFAPAVDVIRAGSTSCTALSTSLSFPGGVEFTTTGNLAIDDQDTSTVSTYLAPSFSTVISTTTLSGSSDPVTFAFGTKDADLISANAGGGNATQFAYPNGGSPNLTWSGLVEPIGVAGQGALCGASGMYRGGIARLGSSMSPDVDVPVNPAGGTWNTPAWLAVPYAANNAPANTIVDITDPAQPWWAPIPNGCGVALRFAQFQWRRNPPATSVTFGATTGATTSITISKAQYDSCPPDANFWIVGYFAGPPPSKFYGPVQLTPSFGQGVVQLTIAGSPFDGQRVFLGAVNGLLIYCQ